MIRKHKVLLMGILASSLILLFMMLAQEARAIPSFARKYETSCQTCHVAFPKLNAFGEAFRNNGYRFPVDDEEQVKQEPVQLGAPAWKRVWPKAVWPSDMAPSVPIALIITNTYEIVPDADVSNDFVVPSEVELFSGGTLGESFSFYGGLTLLDKNEFGGLHRLFGQFNRIKGTSLLNVKFGGFEPRATPFSSHRRLMHTNYLMNNLTTNTALVATGEIATAHAHGTSAFSLGSTQRGVELWGAASGPGGGGLDWAFGVTNGNGLGGPTETTDLHLGPEEPGHQDAEAGGHEEAGEHDAHVPSTLDDNSSKDIYARISYKFGGYGRTGETGQTLDDTKSWVDDSVRVGLFTVQGSAKNPLGGHEPEDYRRYGFDVDLWFKDLNLYAAYMFGKNEIEDHEAPLSYKSHAWFVEADYMLLPWVVVAARYELANVKPVTSNGLQLTERLPILRRVVPHITLLLRANVKLAFESNRYFNNYADDTYRVDLDFAF